MNAIERNATKERTHYAAFESGSLRSWIDNSVDIPGLGSVPGKLFLKDAMGLTSAEISINALPPGGGMPFHHSHRQNEEIYIFLHGTGQMQIDGETFDVREGTIVKVSPKGERVWRNNGNETLVYVVMQMKANSLEQWGTADADIPQKPVVWPA